MLVMSAFLNLESILESLAFVALGALLSLWVSRRTGVPYVKLLALTVCLAPIVVFTLLPDPELFGGFSRAVPGLQRYLDGYVSAGEWGQMLHGLMNDSERVANVALYVPAGLVGYWIVRSVVKVSAAGFLLAFVIEGFQAATATRDGSMIDCLHNSLGAVLGAFVGYGISLVSSAITQPRDRAGDTENREAETADRI